MDLVRRFVTLPRYTAFASITFPETEPGATNRVARIGSRANSGHDGEWRVEGKGFRIENGIMLGDLTDCGEKILLLHIRVEPTKMI